MKISEYVEKHRNEGKKINVPNTVNTSSLVNEIINIVDIVRVEKTKFGKAAYLIQIDDETAFWASDAITKQIDRMVAEGVPLDGFKNCRFLILKKHADEYTDKKGVLHEARDFLAMEFVEEVSEDEE